MSTYATSSIFRTFCILGTSGLLSSATAATVSFVGPNMGTWSTPGFWSNGSVPSAGDSVRILSSSASDFFVSGNVPATISSLDVNSSTSKWTVLATSKNLTVTGDANLGTTGIGSIEQNGGNNQFGHLRLGTSGTGSYGYYTLMKGNVSAGALTVGSSGIGTFNHLKGNVTVDSVFTIGNGSTLDSLYSLHNGKLTVGSSSVIGASGDGFFEQGKGTTDFGALTVASGSGVTGSVKLYGGTVRTDSATVGNLGTGYFEQYGGTHTVAGNVTLGAATGGTGVYTMQNGSLNVAGSIAVGSQGTGVFFHLGGNVTASQGVSVGTGEYQLKNATLTTKGLSVSADGFFTTEGTKSTVRTTGNIDFDPAAGITTRDATLSVGKGSSISLSAVQSDAGASFSSLSGAESWNAISLDKNVTLTLDGTAGVDAIYVDSLNIGSKKPTLVETNITGNGVNIYYNADLKSNKYLKGDTYDLVNGGQLIPVHAPTSTSSGGAGLVLQGAGSITLSSGLTYSNVDVISTGTLSVVGTLSGEITFDLGSTTGTFDLLEFGLGDSLTFDTGTYTLVDYTGFSFSILDGNPVFTGGTWEQVEAPEEASGTLAANGFSDSAPSTVPEPTTALLALLGGASLLARRRARRESPGV